MKREEVYLAQTVKREHGLCCPKCGEGADGGTALSFDPLPQPPQYKRGQLVICAYCGTVNVYDKPLLRTPGRTELRKLKRNVDPDALRLMESMVRLIKQERQKLKLEVN